MNSIPKANTTEDNANKMTSIKMLELWAGDDTPRKGWLKVVSLSGK
jgi:hypothetical protein